MLGHWQQPAFLRTASCRPGANVVVGVNGCRRTEWESGNVCDGSPGNLKIRVWSTCVAAWSSSTHDFLFLSLLLFFTQRSYLILYPWVCYSFLHREAICLLNDAAERLLDYLVCWNSWLQSERDNCLTNVMCLATGKSLAWLNICVKSKTLTKSLGIYIRGIYFSYILKIYPEFLLEWLCSGNELSLLRRAAGVMPSHVALRHRSGKSGWLCSLPKQAELVRIFLHEVGFLCLQRKNLLMIPAFSEIQMQVSGNKGCV